MELEGERVKATREGQEKNKELLTIGGEVSRLEQKKMASVHGREADFGQAVGNL